MLSPPRAAAAEAAAADDTGGKQELALVAKDRISLGGVDVSPLGIGAWSWGDEAFWGYSEAMDEELEEVRTRRGFISCIRYHGRSQRRSQCISQRRSQRRSQRGKMDPTAGRIGDLDVDITVDRFHHKSQCIS